MSPENRVAWIVDQLGGMSRDEQVKTMIVALTMTGQIWARRCLACFVIGASVGGVVGFTVAVLVML